MKIYLIVKYQMHLVNILQGALLRALPPDGIAVVDADGDYASALLAAARCRVVRVGEHAEDLDLRLVASNSQTGEFSVATREGGRNIGLDCAQPGHHHILDALLAVAVASQCGCSWELIAERLPTFSPMPMRWEQKAAGECLIVNDAYNANPMNMIAALQTFVSVPCGGERWLVLGDMLELRLTSRLPGLVCKLY